MFVINGTCYWNSRCCRIAGDTCVFQRDSAPANRARDTVQLLVHCTRFVAAKQPKLEPGRLPCLGSHAGRTLQDWQCMTQPQVAPHWDLVGHSTDCHRRRHWRVGATITSLRQSKGTSLRALVTYFRCSALYKCTYLLTRCSQAALFRTAHILSKKMAMPSYA